MALIKCPECGKEISSFAKACPNCGFPVGYSSQGLEIADGVLKSLGTCTDKNIVIPYGVTEIATCAFGSWTDNGPFDPPEYNGANIESVFIPDSVKKIGSYAFSGCYPLKKLEIPDSVTELGVLENEYNFEESTLKEIKLGRGLDEIQEETFRRCVSLKKITICENTKIESYGNFYGEWDEYDDYPEIEEVNFIGSIEGWLLNPLFIPNAINLLINGKNCNSITEIVVPDTVYGLCSGTLNDFENLHKVTIGANVINIEKGAFNSSIEEIVFEDADCLWEQTDYHPHPDSEPDHDRGTYTTKTISFKGLSPKEIANYIKEQKSRCSWRKIDHTNVDDFDIDFYNENGYYPGEIIFNIKDSVLYGINGDFVSNVKIPNGIKKIAQEAFLMDTGLTNVIIPNTVEIIERKAFCDCSGLSEIIIPDSVKAIGELAFENCYNLRKIILPDSIIFFGNDVFKGCNNLTFICSDKIKKLLISPHNNK